MAIELFNNGRHKCLMFEDLVKDSGLGEKDNTEQIVQTNQFLVVDNGHGALIDPGGSRVNNALIVTLHKYCPLNQIDFILASHVDPDIVPSVNKWLKITECQVMVSKLWTRFIPHFCTFPVPPERIVGIPDEGLNIRLGESQIKAIPAHFMHAEGNFQFYDSTAKILFSGDMGASLVDHSEVVKPVDDFDAHILHMEGFHRRYMVSQKINRFWAGMVRQLDVEWIVPQHGRPFKGKETINRFLTWIENLPCGIDLMAQNNYRVPA